MEPALRGYKPEGKKADAQRDRRMDDRYGSGAVAFAERRSALVREKQSNLVLWSNAAIQRYKCRDGLLREGDINPVAIINATLESNGMRTDDNQPFFDILKNDPAVTELVKDLMIDPLHFDATKHTCLKVVKGINGDIERLAEEDSVIENSDRNEPSSSENLSESENALSGETIRHYIRVWTLPVSVLDEWERRFPVDWAHLAVKKKGVKDRDGSGRVEEASEGDESQITLVYIGACIESTPLQRYQDDRKTILQSTLGRFFQVTDREGICYEIMPLSLPLVRDSENMTSQDLWDQNTELWCIERCLIAAVTRELSLNSAYGGHYTSFRPSHEIVNLIEKAKHWRPSQAPSADGETDPKTKLLIRQHYEQTREIARIYKQKPISLTALEHAISNASKTTSESVLNVAKDIPVRDAFGLAHWYGNIAGPAARLYRSANDAVNGCESRHTAFLDFWAVCIIHKMVTIYTIFFVRILCIIQPRVILVASDKVSSILCSKKRMVLKDDDLVTRIVEDLESDGVMSDIETLCGTEDDEWDDMADGDFMSYVGCLRVVCYGYAGGKRLHWSIALSRLHCGFIAYRPDLQRLLQEINLILAIMGNIVTSIAGSQTVWNETVAQEVVTKAEGIFTDIGLSTILDQRRQQYLLLQRNLLSLSQLVTDAEDDQKAFDKYLAHAFATSNARRELLSKMEVAIGEPGSVTRNAQIDRLVLIEDSPCPSSMTIGDNEWRQWLLTRKPGTALAISATTLSGSLKIATLDNNSVARREELNAQRQYPGFTSTEESSVINAVEYLCNLDTINSSRESIANGWRLIICKRCSAAGIIRNSQAKHFCRDENGNIMIGEPILQRDQHLYNVRLLYPAQILCHPVFGPAFFQQADLNEFEFQRSAIVEAAGVEPRFVAWLKSQRARPDLIYWQVSQEMLLHHVERYFCPVVNANLKDFLWLEQDVELGKRYRVVKREVKLIRRKNGLPVSPFRSAWDFPEDCVLALEDNPLGGYTRGVDRDGIHPSQRDLL